MANAVAPGAAALANSFGGESQSWEDRIREAAYTPSSGTRVRFDFEDVSREIPLRGTVWEFPDVNDAYVQQTGNGARRYPMRCFFSGRDHDLLATAFESALLEHGPGRLEHPLYPPVTVVPFGDITRRDDLKTAANQTVIEVTFWTTIGAVYPSSRADPQNEIAAGLVGFDLAAAEQFQASMRLASEVDKAEAKAGIRGMLKEISDSLQGVSDSVESVNAEFRELQSTVNYGLDVLIGQPLQLAQQISNLIKAPGRALTGIQSRLDAYEDLFDKIFGSAAGNPGTTLESGTSIPLRTRKIANDFHASDLAALNAVGGAVTAVTNHAFLTKPEVLLAAERILALFTRVGDWRDAGYAALRDIPEGGYFKVDTGDSYQRMQRLVALTTGFLVQLSFQAVPERRIAIDRPRTIIDLAAELYGSVDDKLDLLISSNDLVGDEILELRRGRVIRYYPEAA